MFGNISKIILNTSQSDANVLLFFIKALIFFGPVLRQIVFQSDPSVDSFIQFYVHKWSMVSSIYLF